MTNEEEIRYEVLASLAVQGIIDYETAMYEVENKEEFRVYLSGYEAGFAKGYKVANQMMPEEDNIKEEEEIYVLDDPEILNVLFEGMER